MADNLPALVNAGSTFRIVTLTGNHLAGVSGVFPKGMDSQPIFTNYGPGNETTWEVTKGVAAGNPFYRLRVYRYGSIGHGLGSIPASYDNGVPFFAEQVRATNDARHDVRWIATYVAEKGAYTIGPSPTDEDPEVLVWTVPPVTENNLRPLITLERIILQPQLSDTQYFKFEAAPAPVPGDGDGDD